MREILFKAKRIDNGEWVEGYVVKFGKESSDEKDRFGILDKTILTIPIEHRNGKVTMMQPDYAYHNIKIVEVNPSTICQYTGLTDKNGNKIWENDVVVFKHEKFDFDDGLEPWERTCLLNKKEYKRNYVVEFCNTPTHYGLRFRNGSIWFMVHRMTIVMHDVEVIGNIFDNPELLEGAQP